MKSEKAYNWLTSGDRLPQYGIDKVQCRQSGERYLPIKKKINYALYIILYIIVQCHILLQTTP